jgi:H+/Cl- antiporter ClcA
MKYFKAVLFFLITYLFVATFSSPIITYLLSGRPIVYVGTSDDWRTWPANILGILAGIYSAIAALEPKPRKNRNSN